MRRPGIPATLCAAVIALAAILPGVPVAAGDGWTDGTVTWRTPARPGTTGFWGRSLDLDTGEEKPYGAPATDVTLLHSCVDGTCRWQLVGPHGLRRMGSRPVADECAAVTRWTTRGSRTRWPQGTWLCAQTGAGRLARLHIGSWPTRTTPSFSVRYPVWTGGSARTIRLELTAALQILRSGDQVHGLDVTPGDRITFQLTNTAGYDHSFHIGPGARLAAGDTAGLPGVKPFSVGTKTFTYDVTDRTLDLRFGCTVPGHYALMNGRFR